MIHITDDKTMKSVPYVCPNCAGSGIFYSMSTNNICTTCGGSGTVHCFESGIKYASANSEKNVIVDISKRDENSYFSGC